MTNTINGQKDHGTRKSFLLKPLSYSFALHRRALAGSALALSFLGSEMVLAAPQGGVVVGGDGSISVDGKITNVDQASDLLAIDWETFNVDADEMVRFIQSSSSDMVLNRILDENPSAIFGTIDAKGHVLLVNPRGLLFTETSQINVNSLVASGLDIKTEDFMNGNYIFEGKAGTEGYVINKGSISAVSGAVLQGKSVHNTGLVSGGLVALAAGNEAVVTFDADQLIGVKVTKEVLEKKLGIDDAVLNEGTLKGGEVLLTADVAKGLFDNAVNNTGIIEAKGISTEGGVVRLGGFGAQVAHTGKIDVSGEGAGSKGGKVQIEGDTINLTGNASIVATGENGGGTVLIGGDYQGKNADVYNAKNVTVAENVTIDASATENGDGGKVIVWSDDTAEFKGKITARGGKNGGDGGFVETSGKKLLKVTGTVDAGADQGENGSWLLDPENIAVVNGVAEANDNISVDDSDPGNGDSYVLISSLQSSLDDGSDITIQANSNDPAKGNISVLSDITYNNSARDEPTLQLIADNNILISAKIYSSNDYDFNVTLDAQNTVYIDPDGEIDTSGGTLNITTHNFINSGKINLTGFVGDWAWTSTETAGIANITVGRNGGDSKNKLGDITGASAVNVTASGVDTFVQTSDKNLSLTGSVDKPLSLGGIELSNVEEVVVGDVTVADSGDTINVIEADGVTEVNNVVLTKGTLNGSDQADAFTLGSDGDGVFVTTPSIKFRGLSSIAGGDGTDTFTDNPNSTSAWSVSAQTLSNGSITLSQVEELTTAGDITDTDDTGWSVTDANVITSATQGITVSGTKKLNTAGALTDTQGSAWSIEDPNLIKSTTLDLTVSGTT
ncbi:MAG: filamentous hemagglutinin N-terminal domain-containing protein, partial [Endozoicomonas sp.]|uniref:two-partner secretion domain-containing protein n=1 Tax=Endozoicomonas sp. TaxID=1892382 RepID=UPI003D9AD4A2